MYLFFFFFKQILQLCESFAEGRPRFYPPCTPTPPPVLQEGYIFMLKVPSLQIQTRYSAPDAFAFCIKYPIWPWLTLTRLLVKPVPEQLFLDPASSFLNIRVWIKYFNQAFFYTTEKERERE